MVHRDEVDPVPLDVGVVDGSLAVKYQDGRQVRYDQPLKRTDESVRVQSHRHIHVLVFDPSADQGILVYINDLNTEAEILSDTGVGRVFVSADDRRTIYPGVTATGDGRIVEIAAEFETLDEERVFVFEESARVEQAYELFPRTITSPDP